MNKEELAKLYYDTNLQRGKNKAEAGNYLLSGIMKALEWEKSQPNIRYRNRLGSNV